MGADAKEPAGAISATATKIAAADLAASEQEQMRSNGTDFTEAKEAIVDALLGLTVNHCTGSGDAGDIIYGAPPSSKLVSGFLLPRLNASGAVDETSDIHISTIGMDFQVASDTPGTVALRPRANIYIRVLPTWDDIIDPRFDLQPQVQLSLQVRDEINRLAGQYIRAQTALMPEIPSDDGSSADAGDVVAQADAAREDCDIAAQRAAENAGNKEFEGAAKAAADQADRLRKAAEKRLESANQRRGTLRERGKAMAAIRRKAFDEAFEKLGINILAMNGAGPAKRLATADDLGQGVNDASAFDPTDSDEPAERSASDTPADDEAPPAANAAASIRRGAGVLDDKHAAPQPIPQKWKRMELNLGEYSFDPRDRGSIERAQTAFTAGFKGAVDTALSGWLSTDEGKRSAYRPGESILPSNFATREDWDRFVDSLNSRNPAVLDHIKPDFTNVELIIDPDPDFVDASRTNIRIAIENGSRKPTGATDPSCENSLFQVELEVSVPSRMHVPLRLDRIEPSYRFLQWLEYPAMGLNCGVRPGAGEPSNVVLHTTWSPRYVQPRIDPRNTPDVPTAYSVLADEKLEVSRLLALADDYDRWIEKQRRQDASRPSSDPSADASESREKDLEAYQRESGYIRSGIKLLQDSQAAAKSLSSDRMTPTERKRLERTAVPWRAWILTNETFARHSKQHGSWRLFQMAFILAHVPTLASRMPEFEDRFDPVRDELSASLLYFSTGGGKSEAFFGLLIFNLFLDRLRGKVRGVTALIRYPLRLLTLQQARRLTRILVQAELVRLERRIAGWPFELGFWVGSGNTPNRVDQGFAAVPLITEAAHPTDEKLLKVLPGDPGKAKAQDTSDRYMDALESFDKLRTCPCCDRPTGMRRYRAQKNRVGIVCFNDECGWNVANPPAPHRVPLPFLLTDDTIYQRAPSAILGTIDKLALVGQHDRTINAIVGMFGCARYLDPDNQHLMMPRGKTNVLAAQTEGLRPIYPAFSNGEKIFLDPFPSLIIQDEGHLLDESLGTFAGLFETLLERIFLRLGSDRLKDIVASWRAHPQSDMRQPRLAKVIAATATISDPDRQLQVLYQRRTLRFPCPGPTLYESFYAAPQEPKPAVRQAFAASLPLRDRPEHSAPRMRTYASIMTNGRSHTMTTSAVVSAYHAAFARLWEAVAVAGRSSEAVTEMIAALPSYDPLTPLRADALRDVLASSTDNRHVLASLLDLHRISLVYVTNKKGGDQIIETLASQVEHDQKECGIGDLPFETELISGGITIAEIQDVMEKAEKRPSKSQAFEPLGTVLRNIVATSAISHGVDVDRFNAMFFAGLPGDIGEYIQASSRVGRTHVGFSVLIPTPHSRRDRYVVETHDQFHRFLERMIPPPAVQRWTDKAIKRMISSAFQAYLCAVVEQMEFFGAADAAKDQARAFTKASSVKSWADRYRGGRPAAQQSVVDFILEAIGVEGRGDSGIGATLHPDHQRTLVEQHVRALMEMMCDHSDSSRLADFWQQIQNTAVRKPMTSLRDVDAGGQIQGGRYDPFSRKFTQLESVKQVMRIIRGQRKHASRSDVDSDPLPIDVKD
ncbi:DEAD/DEAH box helicase [Dongia soli]|uniref:DEAD/DEAH box helicase n=1 Tax=Dongia soli TaxID=600628 RepID=A0ABU5EHA4_9PROT|nr:DEAD/DEAH box helicase [Dongia soli]MDY0885394.1 DEAD/DEAH box helicase [Dongia soli]